MNSVMEVSDIGLQVLLVVVPSNAINSDGCPLLQIEECFGQTIFIDMMQQGSELERAVLTGSFTHAVQTT